MVIFKCNQDHFLMGFLALVAVASGGDLLTDFSQGASRAHLFQEVVLLLISLLILVWLVKEYRHKKQQIQTLHAELEDIRQMPAPQSDRVVRARHELSQAINEQFQQWSLTQSEQDIGFMLLKGYSLKEIAVLRGTAEKTIRQQASSVYQKSGVSGRHAFSAWFIEDLL